MGGVGSGRWAYHDKRHTVERCWAMSISEVSRVVDLSKPGSDPRPLRPTMTTGRRMSSVRCAPSVGSDGAPLLLLSYSIGDRRYPDRRVEEVVRLQATRPHFGGVRWWFFCPGTADGEGCGRRVGKLYRPPEGRRFACRLCLDLTYESCQTSRRHDRLVALLAGETSGAAFRAVKGALLDQAREARRRRTESSPTLLDALVEAFDGTVNR